ncbi:MAG TPA: winged helix-turn-helix domain-containing protein [Actinomycetota bacterium]
MQTISASEARRIALAAQGFADPRPRGRVDARHLRKVIARTAVLQIDSVNVLARAHYLPVFSRIGPYPTALLDDLAYKRRELFEYWAHEASLIPVELHPLLRFRMERSNWRRLERFADEHAEVLDAIMREVDARGPLGASDVDGHRRTGPWWGWGEVKLGLEYLFWTGRVAVAGRRNFERLYDLPERVLPARVLNAPTPSEEESKTELLRIAARSLGVGTARDLADYFRLKHVAKLLAHLVDEGTLTSVRVEGWRQQAFLARDARAPRAIGARALLAPFDPVVWERSRAERLFGFRYRIEIYTPAPKRVYGYYVLPFLLGEQLVARVDLKADRKAGALLVQGAFAEPGTDARATAGALAEELRTMAAWLGLDAVKVGRRGDLSAPLRRSLGGRARGRVDSTRG